jgi:hypothetical protein
MYLQHLWQGLFRLYICGMCITTGIALSVPY